MADELLQQRGLDQIRLLGDQGLLGQHHLLGGHRVGGEQAPVDVTAVPEVWVVGVLREAERSQGREGEATRLICAMYEEEEEVTCPQISSEALVLISIDQCDARVRRSRCISLANTSEKQRRLGSTNHGSKWIASCQKPSSSTMVNSWSST